jgi:KaiC/GvpD/RAD55 family RecA-like ATPase
MGSSDVQRVSTGINGLDDLIEGGLPEHSVTLVSGGAGTGKTILCSQFLWHGLQNGEKCRFISLEEPIDDIKSDAAVFGWDFSQYEESDDFEITYIKPTAGERGFLNKVKNLASDPDITRLVIDSVSVMLGAYGGNESEKRDNLYDLVRNIKQSSTTTLLTSEIPESENSSLSRYGVSEFVADGAIVLYYSGVAEGTFRNVEVRKMRKTNHTPGTYPFKITSDGINITTESGL